MTELLLVAIAIFGFGMVSERLSTSPITAPMVFTTIGLIIGSDGLGWFDLDLDGEAVSILVEATLVLVLFTDAIRIDMRVRRKQLTIPGRLLGIGLPLTIVAGTGLGLFIIPGLGLAHAALLAAVLAPTDAALGQAVVSDRRLPVRVRQALNVESGLNDGIAVPVVTVLLAIAVAGETGGANEWFTFAARQIGFGVAAGIISGAIGGRILDTRASAGAVEGVYRQLSVIAIAAAFGLAGVLEGNGFIAAFSARLTFGGIARDHCRDVQSFSEDEGELLRIGPMLDQLSWRGAIYAITSLTIIRIVPVLVSMVGSGTLVETRLFLGWFGPRGLASILFALLVAEELESDAGRSVFTVAALTVLASVFCHGVTANPWTARLAGRLTIETNPMPETEPSFEFPTRREHEAIDRPEQPRSPS